MCSNYYFLEIPSLQFVFSFSSKSCGSTRCTNRRYSCLIEGETDSLPGLHNKIPQTSGLNNRNFFRVVLEVRHLRAQGVGRFGFS